MKRENGIRPTAAQMACLWEFAQAYGGTWKAHLGGKWERGEVVPGLMQLRQRVGTAWPEWLEAVDVFAWHRADDPHCTCNDCMAEEQEAFENSQCVLCHCRAEGRVHGFSVCGYHVSHGESDPSCPTCNHAVNGRPVGEPVETEEPEEQEQPF